MTVPVQSVESVQSHPTQSQPVQPLPTHPQLLEPTTTLPLSALTPSGLNPRRRFDESVIAELAASIGEHGLLQNLVVRPHPEHEGLWQIVAGERRYRALQNLLESDAIAEDYPVPVTVRKVSDLDLLLLATTENIQRQDMTPLEEADAFVKLVELGDDEDAIALRTGVSPSTVRLRLKLASGLCADARRALEADRLTLAQAQALLLGSKGLQKELLPRILENESSPKDIKRMLTGDKVPVGRNLFPLEAYIAAKGSITTDLFQPEHPGWFDNRELFIRLQNEAVEKKLEALRATYGETNITLTDYFLSYRYVEGEGAVVVLNHHTFGVEVHEGLVTRPEPKPAKPTPAATDGEKKPKENRRRNEWEATSLTRAIHEEASKDFRLCLVLNVMALIGVHGFDVKLEEGKANRREPNNRVFSHALQEAFDAFRATLAEGGLEPTRSPYSMEEPYLPKLNLYGESITQLFELLKALPDIDLYTLFARLTATALSHGTSDVPWDAEVKRIVAKETGLEVKEHFDASDPDYLALHTRAELGELAKEAGVHLDVTGMKKAAAVTYLSASEKVKVFVPPRLLPKG